MYSDSTAMYVCAGGDVRRMYQASGHAATEESGSPRRGLAQGKLDRDFEAGSIVNQAVATNS